MKCLVPLFALFYGCLAHAQWAVYDDLVYQELAKINQVDTLNTNPTKLDQNFKNQLSTSNGNNGQDLTLGVGSEKSVFKGLDTKFETLTIPASEAEKYVGTLQDCGSKETNEKHYNACAGLRNLRLQTLKQSQEVLKTLDKRRSQIVDLIVAARGSTTIESGIMQRYHFELQALQSLMQTDAMQLQVLMDGYKQREQVYAMQMVEAKRANDTGAFDSGKGIVRKKAVPFVMP